MKKIAVFDIGGTKIKSGIFEFGTGLTDFELFPTNAQAGGPAVLRRVQECIRVMASKHDLVGIGIATAGQVNRETGIVLAANDNMPNYAGINLKEYFEELFAMPVSVDNDLNSALLAELPVENHKKTTVMVAVGTGIGSAIAFDGKVYRGNNYRAGELGYLPMGDSTFEQKASMKSLIQSCQEIWQDEKLTGYSVFAYENSQPKIKRKIASFFDHLGSGLSLPIFMLDPQELIIGGGVAERSDFLERLMPNLKKYVPEDMLKTITIRTAKMGNTAGLIGAARLWTEENFIVK